MQPAQKTINLALQGGGAHGAFAWGVLDKLCEDGRLQIDGLSATSAGAMNAVVFAYHNMQGGYDAARQGLEDFWRGVSDAGSLYNPVRQMPWESMIFGWQALDESISYHFFETFTRLYSPYQFNPLDFNPLADLLRAHVDFDQLHCCQTTRLFIAATNVRTNRLRVFHNEEISCEAVLASACLPMLFQAVEIDGEAYWDGGYMGNPALFPLIQSTETKDIVIVHINPVERDEIPRTAQDILNRVNEVSFNSSLMREVRTLKRLAGLVDAGFIKEEYLDTFPYANLNLHSIRADAVTKEFSVASKFSPEWNFLTHLRDRGREVTARWLEENLSSVGKCCTVDVKEIFSLGPEEA